MRLKHVIKTVKTDTGKLTWRGQASPAWLERQTPTELTLNHMTLPSGIPVDDLDPGIRPQDDLVRYANGGWLARTQIPADRARYDSFRILAEEAEQAVRVDRGRGCVGA